MTAKKEKPAPEIDTDRYSLRYLIQCLQLKLSNGKKWGWNKQQKFEAERIFSQLGRFDALIEYWKVNY